MIQHEGELFVSLCPELDIASQGATVEEARANLTEAIELFFDVADDQEVRERLSADVYVTSVEIAVA